MNLNRQQAILLSDVMEIFAEPLDQHDMRAQLGELVLRLLKAECFVSYLWDGSTGQFNDRIAIGLSDSTLSFYDSYYQFHDPVTHRLQPYRVPTRVTDVMLQKDLMDTEFFNDFLSREGLYWGVNLYAPLEGADTGDMRIWRGKKGENFDETDLKLLQIIMPAFSRYLKRCRQSEVLVTKTPSASFRTAKLTMREEEVVRLVASGMQDKEIARSLNISFTTVRTHIEHSFRKLNLTNRVQLAALI